MKLRTISKIAGFSYVLIFFAAIFGNFYVLEAILNEPIETLQNQRMLVRIGILAFLITVVFDVVVAWALYELYRTHPLSRLSTYFRMMHAAIMGVAIFALPFTLSSTTELEILNQVEIFNTIWLIALFFFGIHLILLGRIIGKPQLIGSLLVLAGIMYMVDTAAHFLLPNYNTFSTIFLVLVAVPSMIGEMSLAIWLLVRGGKN